MSRQIDADRLYEVIKNSWDTSDAEDFEKSVFVALATAPTIEERKTGQWNRYCRMRSGDTFVCNRCGSCFVVLQGEDKMNFCPNCNADMRGKEE